MSLTTAEFAHLVQTTYKAAYDTSNLDARVTEGERMMVKFHPPLMRSPDYEPLADCVIATAKRLAEQIKGDVPPNVYFLLASAIQGAYGMGVRRGTGEVYKMLAGRVEKYLDPLTDEVVPDLKQLFAASELVPQYESAPEPVPETEQPKEAELVPAEATT